MEHLVALGDDAIHLAGRHIDPQLQELLQNQGLAYMRMVVLVENEALQRGVKVTKRLHFVWKSCHNVAALWSLPPLPSTELIVRLHHQTLNREILIALELTARRDVLSFDNNSLMDLKAIGLPPLGGAGMLCAAPQRGTKWHEYSGEETIACFGARATTNPVNLRVRHALIADQKK